MNTSIEERLSGGHPNSLGATIEVAEDVLRDSSQTLMNELCKTYNSKDEVVRLRVSSALKRVCGLHRESISIQLSPKPEWILQRFDWLIQDIGKNLDQPSAKWSIAQMVRVLRPMLTQHQYEEAKVLLKHNLENEKDWIVQNMTATTLAAFAEEDVLLKKWLLPRLRAMSKDNRKSVAAKARKLLVSLDNS